jgi:hypothetical protein
MRNRGPSYSSRETLSKVITTRRPFAGREENQYLLATMCAVLSAQASGMARVRAVILGHDSRGPGASKALPLRGLHASSHVATSV